MTAFTLLAEEPEIGWRVFLLIMAVSVIGTCAVAWVMCRSVRWHSDDGIETCPKCGGTQFEQGLMEGRLTRSCQYCLVFLPLRNAAALGKGAKR